MNRTANAKSKVIIAAATVSCIVALTAILYAAETTSDESGEFWSQYRIIVERNIFSRNRGARTAEHSISPAQDPRPSPTPQPESYLALKGIARANESFVAFFEDSRGGEVTRVRAGDAIARGRIVRLSLDSAVYQNDANTVEVTVGHTLEGELAGTVPTFENLLEWSATDSAGRSTGDANGTETLSDDAEVLRKLMERRRQELGDQ